MPSPELHLPFPQQPTDYLSVVMKAAIASQDIGSAAREAVWAVDAELPVDEQVLEERIHQSQAARRGRFAVFLIGSLAAISAGLAILGVYGVLGYSVSRRTREIGIRIALGAGRREVVHAVLKQGLLLLAAGLALGLAGALLTVRLLERLLYSVSPTDARNLLGVALLVSIAAIAASCIPSFRAARIDPAVAFRNE